MYVTLLLGIPLKEKIVTSMQPQSTSAPTKEDKRRIAVGSLGLLNRLFSPFCSNKALYACFAACH
jgi:hypothetical protein